MKSLAKFVDAINILVKYLTIAMLFVALLVIIFQVICRYIVHFPLGWTDELARYLVVYVVYFAASLAARHNQLTRLEIVIEVMNKLHCSKAIRTIFDWIAGVFAIIFYIIAIYCTTCTLKITHGQVSAAMAIPMFIPYMGVYIGSILLVINTLMQILAPAVDVAEGSAE